VIGISKSFESYIFGCKSLQILVCLCLYPDHEITRTGDLLGERRRKMLLFVPDQRQT